MTLAESYLLARDLSVIKDQTLTDFYSADEYTHHNTFSISQVFPAISMGSVSMLPRVDRVGRWGRHIILTFSTCTMVFKMAYRTSILITREAYPNNIRHSDIACLLTFGSVEGQQLFFMYADKMGCGQFTVYPVGETPAEFSYLGMDVLDVGFTPQYLMSEAAKLTHLSNSMCIKSFIMSPNVIAWIDNEFASEVLFLAGIHPLTDVVTGLTYHNAVMLVKSFKMMYSRVMECARNDYCLTTPIPLSALYSIYDREDQECVVCGAAIRKAQVDDRPTYWCPTCQAMQKKGLLNECRN